MRLSSDTSHRGRREPFGYIGPLNHLGWQRVFCCYFHFVAWDCISLGGHISLACPNIEVHLPFGFIRIGWLMRWRDYDCET